MMETPNLYRLAACLTCCCLLGCGPAAIEQGNGGASSSTHPSTESHAASHKDREGHEHAEHAHENSQESDGHTHPADLSSAVAELKKLTEAIRSAFENETPEEAHDALHEVGHLLEAIPGLAARQNADKPIDVDALKEHVELLFDAFTTLDDTLHGGEDVEFSEVDQKITSNFQALQELTQ